MQWGYAGLFNVGIMGFTAVGGLAVVLVAQPPVPEAWAAGGPGALLGLLLGVASNSGRCGWFTNACPRGGCGAWPCSLCWWWDIFITSAVFGPATQAIEDVNPRI